MASSAVPNLPPAGCAFGSPSGRELIEHYLVPKALRGELPYDIILAHTVEGMAGFSASAGPGALHFQRIDRRRRAEAPGFLFAVNSTGEKPLSPGRCWLQYGPEKAYYCVGAGEEAVAFRRRFAFYATRQACHGRESWSKTQPGPKANMDFVVRKVFTEQVAPLPLPLARSSDEESTGSNNHLSLDEEACCSSWV